MDDNNRGRSGRHGTDNDYMRDGVYYTPSNDMGRPQRPSGRQPQRSNAGGGNKRRKSSQKSQLSVYYIIALLVSVSVCVAAFTTILLIRSLLNFSIFAVALMLLPSAIQTMILLRVLSL